MILTGHQPNYLPYAGFFEKIARADRFLVVDNVQFVKRGTFGWMHRNRIRSNSPEGWDWLSVPVLSKGKYTQQIREAEIDNSTPWARKHWRSIEWNYRRAPHFKAYADGFRELYEKEWKSFCELSCAFIELILRVLGVSKTMDRTSALGITGESTGLVLSMCKATGADTYLSGVHGRDYLDEAEFGKQGIRLLFQDYACPPYPQCWPGEFIPNLSVIDLIFNCGPDSLKVITGDRAA
jgi:hypothetical protein